MLSEIILELTELDVTSQRTLFEVMLQRKAYREIARLAGVANLDPELDARIGKIPAAEVKAAWLQRTGRTQEEVVAALRSERRVTVLTTLVDQELDVASYPLIARANSSATLALAILACERAGQDAKEIAAGHLATSLNDGKDQKRHQIRTALGANPEVLSAFAMAATHLDAISVAAEAEMLNEAAASHVVTCLARHLTELVDLLAPEKVAQRSPHETDVLDNVSRQLARITECALSRAWCTDDQAAGLEAALTACAGQLDARLALLAPDAQRHPYLVRMVEQLRDAFRDGAAQRTEATQASSGVFALVARAAAATTDEEVEVIVTEADALRASPYDSRTDVVYAALMRNERLSPLALERAVRCCSYEMRRQFYNGRDVMAYPVSCWAAIAVAHPWAFPVQAIVDAGRGEDLLDALRPVIGNHGNSHVIRLLAQLVTAGALGAEALCGLPFNVLLLVLADGEVPPPVRQGVAAVVETALRGQPQPVWEAFERMGRDFTGTLDALVAMCRASAA